MAITTRQTSMLVAEDWKKLYQTFREADFQSYDFQTLRKSMIDYLRLYYPEDFNDFIESSEFIAQIDLLAFLGQSLAFRTDLNARENFIDTAERRDSILKLARLINYVPKRSTSASGFLKIDSISTTEVLYDSNGTKLNKTVVTWNDSANSNWLEQFITIFNAALVNSQLVGNPGNSQIINNIKHDEYSINLLEGITPIFKFTTKLEGNNTLFEIVSSTTKDQLSVYEKEPLTNNQFNILYKNDGLGNSSNNTGFFFLFKQGDIRSQDISIAESIPNRVIGLEVENVNNDDIWLYSLDATGNTDTLWTKVPAVVGSNIVYNKSSLKNLYQVNSRDKDKIDLIFGDGSFANIPQGKYRLFYRVCNGKSYRITPSEIRGISVPIQYLSRSNRTETLTIRASLNYTVANASETETNDDIRQRAPQQYYTQNRMITGEDYNIFPYTNFNNVIKVKAVNRTSSGISRYLDVVDTTGKYSSTNIFAQDGNLYKDTLISTSSSQILSNNDIYDFVYNTVKLAILQKEIQHFYFANYSRTTPAGTASWELSNTKIANGSIGTLSGVTGVSTISVGDILKFQTLPTHCFDVENEVAARTPSQVGDKSEIYATVMAVTNLTTTSYNLTLNAYLPGSVPANLFNFVSLIPVFKNDFSTDLITQIVTGMQNRQTFGLNYNETLRQWEYVTNPTSNTSTYAAGSGAWLLHFLSSGNNYLMSTRELQYIFESTKETKFYFDDKIKVFDPKTGMTITDQINILKVNSKPDNSGYPLLIDQQWTIYDNIIESDGFENNEKILITFTDVNADGSVDNPDLFSTVVAAEALIFFKANYDYNKFLSYKALADGVIETKFATLDEARVYAAAYDVGQVFFTKLNVASTSKSFFELTDILNQTFVENTTDYKYKYGRSSLYFQYRHNSPNYRRIDPSPSNIIDLYLLTKSYEKDYRTWIQDNTGTIVEPIRPTTEELRLQFSSLENYKSVSDAIIYNCAKFKPIFGRKAPAALQAVFRVIKNTSTNVSDNDIKSNVINAINTYFDINNWDFGETFYFSELSAYLHSVLAPNISSIIIVPANNSVEGTQFGSLFQINAEADEIIVSSATVDNVELITDINATNLK